MFAVVPHCFGHDKGGKCEKTPVYRIKTGTKGDTACNLHLQLH